MKHLNLPLAAKLSRIEKLESSTMRSADASDDEGMFDYFNLHNLIFLSPSFSRHPQAAITIIIRSRQCKHVATDKTRSHSTQQFTIDYSCKDNAKDASSSRSSRRCTIHQHHHYCTIANDTIINAYANTGTRRIRKLSTIDH